MATGMPQVARHFAAHLAAEMKAETRAQMVLQVQLDSRWIAAQPLARAAHLSCVHLACVALVVKSKMAAQQVRWATRPNVVPLAFQLTAAQSVRY